MQPGTEAPKRLDLLLRPGNDYCVEAKQESGEGGGDGPEKDAALHVTFSRKMTAVTRPNCLGSRGADL
jgi:hypothetical protein